MDPTQSAYLQSVLSAAHMLMDVGMQRSGPKCLSRMLDLAVQASEHLVPWQVSAGIRSAMLSSDPNDAVRLDFGRMLRAWDSESHGEWTQLTRPWSVQRRHLVYSLLELTAIECEHASVLFPLEDGRNSTLVIADSHQRWYSGARCTDGFYWNAYRAHLKKSGWSDESLTELDSSSGLVIERLSDPFRRECYQTKGLVVGFVQSGKTANFTGVVAKAADAGYRLIVVLAGSLEVLRSQTQRRMDKELIGQELIQSRTPEGAAHDYAADRDWQRFIRHGALPSRLGAFDIERLTGLRDDYSALRRGIGALEFQGRFPERPYNHPDNLAASPVRIVVLKKHPSRIQALRRDLKRLQHTSLSEVPALIIDDESDQASINTTRPPSAGVARSRTSTNGAIVELLAALPRAQYVGYTATPFANVFIDPADAEDLFPKDFLIGLKRPQGYMGVRDFFDFDEDGRPLDGEERPGGYFSNERAFLRDVRARDDHADDDEDKDRLALPGAIDSFILSGAVKLYRASRGASVDTRHHTMLVHRSTSRDDHAHDRSLVSEIFDAARYGTKAALRRLELLWRDDYLPVCRARGGDLPIPTTFEDLRSGIDQAIERIARAGRDHGPVRIVNAEPGLEDQAPDFDQEDVWSILVGGAKLSRGFTVEGLTISYFRRRVRTADTLMQTGRWFGFRRGYQDLVRVFFGRHEPDSGSSTFDLQEAFKAICMDEEGFRAQLLRYVSDSSAATPITPRQIPPLVPQHLLAPAASNKMYNAVVRFLNFGNSWAESTRLPPAGHLTGNARLVRKLLMSNGMQLRSLGASGKDGVVHEWTGYVATASPCEISALLENLTWSDGMQGYVRECEFLRGTGDNNPGIDRWVILVPQQGREVAVWDCGPGLKIVQRSRIPDARGIPRFKAFSERRHRVVAEVIGGAGSITGATADTVALRTPRTAVMLLYPVVEDYPKESVRLADAEVAMGVALFFPENGISRTVVFGVRDGNHPDAVVVDSDGA